MDLSPRALARWLPSLAFVLALEAATSLVLALTAPDFSLESLLRTLAQLPHVAVLIGLSIAIPVMTSGGATRQSCQRLLWGGFAAIAATALARFEDISFDWNASRAVLLLHGLGSFLLGAAGPGLWGTSLARQDDLQDARIAHYGRAFAITAGIGFGSYFVSEVLRLSREGPFHVMRDASLASVLFTGLLLASRLPLLLGAIEFLRTPADEIATRNQSRRVQILMLVWLIATSAAWIFSSFVGIFESARWAIGDTVMLIWHAVVQVTLTLIVTLLVALSQERPGISFDALPKRTRVPNLPPPPPGDRSPIDVP